MNKLWIDFETKSSLPISVGTHKYLHTKDSDLLCMGYAWNDEPVKLWVPGLFADFREEPYEVYAHNIQFDRLANNILGKKHGFPEIKLEQCVDIMALCGRYTIPQSLENACKVLEVKTQKRKSGARLMTKITQPPFEYTRAEFAEFLRYCRDDVIAMREVVRALPSDHLSDEEQQNWINTVRINLNGLPVDTKAAARIYATTCYYRDQQMKKVPQITDGAVKTINQVQAIRDWCADNGTVLPDLTAATVEEVLNEDWTTLKDTNVRRILELRQELGRSSIAKYKKLLDNTYLGRVYDNLRYYGAATGRWSGLAFQMQNLPRATVDDIETSIQQFYDTSILAGDPMYAAKALIRSVICAPEGHKLAIADYKAIENRVIAWVCGEFRILKLFREGLDEYKDFASKIFGVRYDDVTSKQRFFGKVVILGAGYNLGAAGFLEYAAGYGLDITTRESEVAINTYRREHPKIVKFWWRSKDATIAAVKDPGVSKRVGPITFKVVKDRTGRSWLITKLPSGRNLFYCEPRIKDDRFGEIVVHKGINSYNKQWSNLKLIPGRIIENIVQALARDIMAVGIQNLFEWRYKVVGTVHDEVILEIEDEYTDKQLEHTFELLCNMPTWADGLPLAAEGAVVKRYRKI